MVLTTPMVLTQTHDRVEILLHHTCMRGMSVVQKNGKKSHISISQVIDYWKKWPLV